MQHTSLRLYVALPSEAAILGKSHDFDDLSKLFRNCEQRAGGFAAWRAGEGAAIIAHLPQRDRG
jgi:hypothetical protein